MVAWGDDKGPQKTQKARNFGLFFGGVGLLGWGILGVAWCGVTVYCARGEFLGFGFFQLGIGYAICSSSGYSGFGGVAGV